MSTLASILTNLSETEPILLKRMGGMGLRNFDRFLEYLEGDLFTDETFLTFTCGLSYDSESLPGIEEIAKVIISTPGIDLNQKNKKGQTPLWKCCRANDLEGDESCFRIMEMLIDAGADMNIPYKGKTLFEHLYNCDPGYGAQFRVIDRIVSKIERFDQIELKCFRGKQTLLERIIDEGLSDLAVLILEQGRPFLKTKGEWIQCYDFLIEYGRM